MQDELKKLIQMYNQQEFEKAIDYANIINNKYPKKSIVYNILGAIYTKIKLFDNAIINYKEAIKLDPNNSELYNNLGVAYKLNFSISEAINQLIKAIKINNNYSEAYYNLGNCNNELGDYIIAENYYKKAIKLKPNYAEAYNNLSVSLNFQKKYQEAEDSVKKAIHFNQGYAEAFKNLGLVLVNLNKFDEAIQSFRKAISITPNYSAAYSELCDYYEKSNEIDNLKKTVLEFSLNVDKQDPLLIFRKAQLASREKKYLEAEKLLVDMNVIGLSNSIITKRLELLSKTYDKLKKYNLAYEAIIENNTFIKSIPKNKSFSGIKYRENIENIIKSYKGFDSSVLKNNNNNIDENLIFLIGFPRSGTTLLDTILSSHNKILTVEEMPMVNKMKSILGHNITSKKLTKLNQDKIQECEKAYFSELSKHININDTEKLIIDKLPLNIIDVHLINSIFPASKFILVLRHPCDTVLSCLMQSFDMNDAMASFLDLKETAELYNLVMTLWKIFEERLDLDFHTIKYENLIDDLEKETTLLLNFLDLEWDENIKNYQKTALLKKSKTPSYNQITEKLYKSSQNRWENYKSEIYPIIPLLEKWLKIWDYKL